MALVIPIDIVEEIIDRAADDPQSLRQLALTCSLFLPRSRYHMLAWHVSLRTKSHLQEFDAHLRANSHIKPVIRAVKIQIPRGIFDDDALKRQGGLSTIFVLLLTLPHLQHWTIYSCCFMRNHPLGFGFDQLEGLMASTTSTMTLDLVGMQFPNITEFTLFLLVFPTLRFLRLSTVDIRKDVTGPTFGRAKERLAKQLRLTSLKIGEKVHESIVALLLEISRSTIEDLELEFEHMQRNTPGRDNFYDLMGSMSALHSITMQTPSYCISIRQLFMVDAWQLIKALPTTPTRAHTIVVNSLACLNLDLAEESLVDLDIRRQIEQFFLGQPSHCIVFTAVGTKRRRKTFWMTTLGRYFPRLHQRGQLKFEYDESGDTYDMTGHDAAVLCLAVSPDSKWAASGSSDNTIILWDVRRGNILREWLTHQGTVRCLAVSPDSRFLASGGDERSLVIWDVNEGCERVATLSGSASSVVACAWSPDGTLLASAEVTATVCVWDVQTFTQLHRFENGDMVWPRSVRFSPDGRWLAFQGNQQDYKIWDTLNRRLHKTLHADIWLLGYAAFDCTSRRIVVPAWDDTVVMWDVETGEELLVLRGHEGCVLEATLSPNGDRVLSASADGSAKVWDSHTGEQILSFDGHTDGVCSACFSPDGKYVASASKDKSVQLWRTHDGACMKTFKEHTECVTLVLFSPDGKTLLSCADDGTVCIRQLGGIIL